MENLKVRELTDLDKDEYEDFIQEHVAFEKEYFADNFSYTKKKYIQFRSFSEWYKKKSKDSKIYLVFKEKNKRLKLVGAFEIDSFENRSTIFMDIRPLERGKGYEDKIINFIRNVCVFKDMHEVKVITSVPNIITEYRSRDDDDGHFTHYDIEKHKVLKK